jgi:hypothetical protein
MSEMPSKYSKAVDVFEILTSSCSAQKISLKRSYNYKCIVSSNISILIKHFEEIICSSYVSVQSLIFCCSYKFS